MTQVNIGNRRASKKRNLADLAIGDFFYDEDLYVCVKTTPEHYFAFDIQSTFAPHEVTNVLVHPIKEVSIQVGPNDGPPPRGEGRWLEHDYSQED